MRPIIRPAGSEVTVNASPGDGTVEIHYGGGMFLLDAENARRFVKAVKRAVRVLEEWA